MEFIIKEGTVRTAQRMLALNRKEAPRSKQPPRLPPELRTVHIQDLPAAVEELLNSTPMQLREAVIEQLVWAVKSDDDDIRSRAGLALVSLGPVAIMQIGQMVLHFSKDTHYRLRLVWILGEIGQKHREAMGPLLQLLSTTKVPEILAAARSALCRIGKPQLP